MFLPRGSLGVRAAASRGLAVTVAALVLALAGAGAPVEPARADTVRGLAWHLDALRIEQAHRQSTGRGVVVALIGSGVDADHPDLKGRVLRGRSFNTADAADGREDVTQDGYGTGLAGLIVGPGGGAQRLLGIAPDARILPANLGREYDTETIRKAIRWAADQGAQVINVTTGAAFCLQEDYEAVRYALRKDSVVVAAVGETRNTPGTLCPASSPGVVGVGASTKAGDAWLDNAVGTTALVAPGTKIIMPAPGRTSENGYVVASSTGQAAAIVSGVAALVRSKYPDLRADDVINRLIRTARDEEGDGSDGLLGYGVVDPVRALTARVRSVDANPLGTPSASPAPTARAARHEKEDDGPWITFRVVDPVGAAVQVGLVVGVVILVIVLVLRNRRGRRRMAAAGHPAPPGPLGPPGQFAPPGPPGPPRWMPPQPGPPYPQQGGPHHPPGPHPAPPPPNHPGQQPYPPAPQGWPPPTGHGHPPAPEEHRRQLRRGP